MTKEEFIEANKEVIINVYGDEIVVGSKDKKQDLFFDDIPPNVTFENNGYVTLESNYLETLPKGTKFRNRGSVYLDLVGLPYGVTFDNSGILAIGYKKEIGIKGTSFKSLIKIMCKQIPE